MILKEKQLKSISKFLSFILRHHPEQIGITLDKDGWVDIDTLLTQVNHPERSFMGNPLTYEILLEVVEKNDKKRFTLSEDGKRIRAAQG
ncbi:RNA 2'-phosphotransferase, partial [Neisseria sp. P0021.S007]